MEKKQGLDWGTSFGLSFAACAIVFQLWSLFFGEPSFGNTLLVIFIFPFTLLPVITVLIKTISESIADAGDEAELPNVSKTDHRKHQLKMIWFVTFWLFVLAGFLAYRLYNVTK